MRGVWRVEETQSRWFCNYMCCHWFCIGNDFWDIRSKYCLFYQRSIPINRVNDSDVDGNLFEYRIIYNHPYFTISLQKSRKRFTACTCPHRVLGFCMVLFCLGHVDGVNCKRRNGGVACDELLLLSI